MPRSDHEAIYQDPPLENIPMIGTSIGGIDLDGIGTLGLYVECTKKDGKKDICTYLCACSYPKSSSQTEW